MVLDTEVTLIFYVLSCTRSVSLSSTMPDILFARLHYKNNYENFKLRMTWLSMLLTFCNLLVFQNRYVDSIELP